MEPVHIAARTFLFKDALILFINFCERRCDDYEHFFFPLIFTGTNHLL